ncbi:SCO family protein [Variovorax sp. RA8]|uniref:SCO family protein n=1 Tax=Variovorax sp. (strain JCM 16519 / RA8) TaxID=662548 RepID=UPI001317A873|nr:BsSco [Variovorax sp. RA8]
MSAYLKLCRWSLLLIVAMASACSPAPQPFNSVEISGAEYARKLELPDADGRVRTLSDFKGKVTVVFFGFTSCPDVCPTTLTELAEVKRSLGKDGARVQGVLVTIDPERDTPEVLKAYMSAFDPSFVALRGSPEQTQATAKEFRVYYRKVPNKEGTNYSMDHTAASYVFDPQGRVRLFTRYGIGAKPLAADIKRLLAES